MNSPFKFLDAYTKADREIFFGRDREIEEHERLKDSVIAQLQTELLDLYHKIKQKRPEMTVAAVESSCCMGCHMNIPPQLFNEIKTCQKVT